ncbi:MAG: NADH:ubiquinone oxidoreductase 18 kDa subunit [Monoraphidium minutum]|nr:MAG: NADH:ubiquinone oxidoreductase 18 kDa subunit [Monoraphidium minutum]
MLQAAGAGLRAGGAFAPALGSALQRALFSTAATEGDYSLVMAQAAELAKETASAPLPPGEGGVTFGVPMETFQRKAIVMSASRVAGQQGVGNTAENASAPGWRIEFEARGKWQNPLQGWNSTADPLENVGRSSLFFFTKEQAVAYAEKAGWEVEVVAPNARRRDRQRRYNAYGDNYTIKRNGLPDLSHLAAYGQKK